MVEISLFSPLLLQVSDQMLPCCSFFAGSVWTYPYIFVRLPQSPCFHQNLMNGCYAQDGDHDWSDSCTCSLPAHPCRLEINSLSTTSKNADIRGDHSSSSSFNPNTIRFLLSRSLQPQSYLLLRRLQSADCIICSTHAL